jgi:hypothetical protein
VSNFLGAPDQADKIETRLKALAESLTTQAEFQPMPIAVLERPATDLLLLNLKREFGMPRPPLSLAIVRLGVT